MIASLRLSELNILYVPMFSSTLAGIILEIGQVEHAAMIHRDVLEYRVRHAGGHDPKSLAAKGDLAVALSELGEDEEAVWLEEEAFESGRAHLGRRIRISFEHCSPSD